MNAAYVETYPSRREIEAVNLSPDESEAVKRWGMNPDAALRAKREMTLSQRHSSAAVGFALDVHARTPEALEQLDHRELFMAQSGGFNVATMAAAKGRILTMEAEDRRQVLALQARR